MESERLGVVGGVQLGSGRDVWRVTTEDSSYVLDYALGALERMPREDVVAGLGPGESGVGSPADGRAQMRHDGELVPLLWVDAAQVGGPLIVVVLVRDDGMPTVRVSTPIVAVELVADVADGSGWRPG